ncbi:MAG: DUF2240 family protein [Methanomassiliicoccales archaeon]|jgi:hypothetical protein
MSELETSLALLFKRKGKNVLTEKEFVFSASMDFRWLSPKEAQMLLELGIKRGLLESRDGFVKPTFHYKDLDIPVSFHPSKDVLKDDAEQSTFALILDDIARTTGQKKREIVAKVNKIQEKLGVDVEVAALAIAKDSGVDVSKYVDRVRTEILARY